MDATPLGPVPPEAEPSRLAIIEAIPREVVSGSAVALRYTPAALSSGLDVWVGKQALPILSQIQGMVVVALPGNLTHGPLKVRLSSGSERSKAFGLHVKRADWRKPFRNLCGGLVLLIVGVRGIARATRSLSGLSSWCWPARTAWRFLALGVGALLGMTLQSTTAGAGFLAGAASARRLPLQPAAALFLGAQCGCAAAPLLFASASEPHFGLLAVALGGLGLCFARVRTARATAWLVLCVGLVAFAVQVLRPGLDSFLSNPSLWRALDSGEFHPVASVLLGALLVAIFQGPSLVLVLALVIAQLTGHEHTHATLLLLSGTGLGSALAASLTTPAPGCRALVELNLVFGASSTLLTAATVDVWEALARRLASHAEPLHWGTHPLPSQAWGLCAAFAVSQLVAASVLVLLSPHAQRTIQHVRHRLQRRRAVYDLRTTGPSLIGPLSAYAQALPEILRLAVEGERAAGTEAERCLHRADTSLHELLSASDSSGWLRTTLTCMQLQRGIESALWRAQQLTDARVHGSDAGTYVPQLSATTLRALRAIETLVEAGLVSVRLSLQQAVAPDRDEMAAREILINALEFELREQLSDGTASAADLLALALVDALECVGNQLYRLADGCHAPEPQTNLPELAVI